MITLKNRRTGDLAEKEGITALAAGETYTRTHTISILA